jgi:hypothetical protein
VLVERDTGQGHAERGLRFRNEPQFVAASVARNKPARIMALLLVRTVCLRVYAAGASRRRTALTA